MVAYNLQALRARDVINGVVCAVLKPPAGKRPHVAVGGKVHLFCGAQPPLYFKAPDCHRLMVAPCTRSDPIRIEARGAIVGGRLQTNPDWTQVLARADGYADFGELQAAYDRLHGLPWEGQLIRWNPLLAEFRAQWPLIEKPPDPSHSGADPPDTE